MADASRFPTLALPFAITGAVAGWLSAGLLSNPLVSFRVSRPIAAGCAALVAAAAGLAIRRLCVGRKRYYYEIDEPDPGVRPHTDRWFVHALLVLCAGATAGALVCAADGHTMDDLAYMIGGAQCALVFLPVCLAVIAAARRAQRARLGSIVAESDRRAVRGILAITLAVTTIEALPDWPAWRLEAVRLPLVVIAALLAAAAVTALALRADRAALREAQATIAGGLSAREPAHEDPAAGDVARVDLGIGDDLLSRVARGAAAYRHRERAVALVQGNPDRALAALQKAVRRGRIGLVVIGVTAALHLSALTTRALVAYEEARCDLDWNQEACAVAAALIDESDPARSAELWRLAKGDP